MATQEHAIPPTEEHPSRPQVDAHRTADENRPLVADLDRRRLLELASAIREHESRVRGQVASPRPQDLSLYRRLRQIGGSR